MSNGYIDRQKLIQCFKNIGKSVEDKLDRNEFDAVLCLAGLKFTDDEMKVLLKEIDPQEKRLYGLTETVKFIEGLERTQTAVRNEKRAVAIAACRKFDKNRSGSLDGIKLTLALSTTRMKLSEEQSLIALQEGMESPGALLNYAEFIEHHLLD